MAHTSDAGRDRALRSQSVTLKCRSLRRSSRTRNSLGTSRNLRPVRSSPISGNSSGVDTCGYHPTGSGQLRPFAKIGGKSYPAALLVRLRHELSDGSEDGGDGRIVLAESFVQPSFELGESASQIFVGTEHFAQLYGGAHDLDIHGDCAAAGEHGRKHRDALFGKGIR